MESLSMPIGALVSNLWITVCWSSSIQNSWETGN